MVERSNFSLDPTVEFDIHLSWPASVPEFSGAINMYLHRPFAEPPEPRCVLMIVHSSVHNARNVLVLSNFKSHRKEPFSDYKIAEDEAEADFFLGSTEYTTFQCICHVVFDLIKDTETFAQDINQRINSTVVMSTPVF